MARTATRTRTTRETDIAVTLDLDGTGVCRVATGIGFLDHMLELFARHALVDLDVKASGDVHVDYHHTVEDVGLVLGACLNEALGDRRGIRRYGFFLLPMDETLCEVALDLGGRPFLVFASAMKHMKVRDFEVKLLEEFFRALTVEGRLNLHLRQAAGDEVHHVCEAVFKGFARALRMAVELDPRETGVPSSKGTLV
jgi:imidazoleglycerol-phosphate dehydratase